MIEGCPVAAGPRNSLFIDECHQVWGCGNNIFLPTGPKFVQDFVTVDAPVETCVVSVGGSHILFLNANGEVWSCGGHNDFFQLGYEEQEWDTLCVKQIENIPKIQAVSASYDNHSLLLDVDGLVWVCGNNRYGQLGLADCTLVWQPRNLGNLPPIKGIATGRMHSVFLGEDGTVWGCGNNINGQLGL